MASQHFIRPLTKEEYLERLPTVKLNEHIRIRKMPSKATGTARRVPMEKFTKGLYKEKAKMNAFKMKPNNVASWIKVMVVRYYSQMGEIEEIDCSWRDIMDNDEADKSNDLEDKSLQ